MASSDFEIVFGSGAIGVGSAPDQFEKNAPADRQFSKDRHLRRTPFPARIGEAHVLGGHACVVRKISAIGAEISVSRAAKLDGLLILRMSSRTARQAHLVARTGDLARIRFSRSATAHRSMQR